MAHGAALSIHSASLTAVVVAETAGLARMVNRDTGETFSILADNSRIELDSATVDLSRVKFTLRSRTPTSLRFVGRSADLEVTRIYSVPGSRAYLDRTLAVKNTGKTPLVIKTVTDGSLQFARPFASHAFHQDVLDQADPGTEWCTETDKPVVYRAAINVFLRNTNGGLCIGLKYPFFKPTLSNSSLELAYETNLRLEPGELQELPTLFCGVYRCTGYVCRKELWWKPRILSTAQEEMDWGEVRAMQAILRDHLPKYPTGFDGYFMWLNSWWANRSLQGRLGAREVEGFKELMTNVRQSQCLDLLGIAPVWCGWAGYIAECPEIDAIGADATFPTNDSICQLLAASKSKGVPTSGFCEPFSANRHYRKDRPDWAVQPTLNSSKRLNMRCQANPEYEDWFYRLICSTIDTCQIKSWSWDFGWFRSPMICHGSTHHHEPGNCEFQQYLNITGVVQKLRQRYPNLFLEVYWGLKEGGPWGLRGLNSFENAYENNSPPPPGMSAADDLRFQMWYNHNYRFTPTYLNLAHINFNIETNGHLYSLMSCLSASTHASLADWIPFKTDSEADQIFGPMRKWKRWATEHMAFLEDRIDLFGQPCRTNGIDGSAHIIGDRGYLFVFNPWNQPAWGSVPLDERIGLKQRGAFSFDEISGSRPKRAGICASGDNFVFSIPARSALLFEMMPAQDDPTEMRAPVGVNVQRAFVR